MTQGRTAPLTPAVGRKALTELGWSVPGEGVVEDAASLDTVWQQHRTTAGQARRETIGGVCSPAGEGGGGGGGGGGAGSTWLPARVAACTIQSMGSASLLPCLRVPCSMPETLIAAAATDGASQEAIA